MELLKELLREIVNGDTETIRRLLKSGKVKIPRTEDGFPSMGHAEAWREFFEGEHDYGVNLDNVDWDFINREFYS